MASCSLLNTFLAHALWRQPQRAACGAPGVQRHSGGQLGVHVEPLQSVDGIGVLDHGVVLQVLEEELKKKATHGRM